MINCKTCAHCTYIHEYECYICIANHRLAFCNITSELDCPYYEEFME